MKTSYWTNQADKESFEIRETKDGRLFAIRNIREEVKEAGDKIEITFIADVAGDKEAGQEYLRTMANFIAKHSQVE